MSDQVATVVSGNTYTVSPRYDFTDSKILGKGSFGVVATAIDTVRGIKLAVKRIRPYANDEWDARHTLREVRLMRLLGRHPNIISLYELSLYPPKTELYMFLELMDSDLHKVIQSSKPLTDRHCKCFLKQMLEGIKAMHAIGVFHRDLKPGNILVSKDCQLRITDFGLARFMDESTRVGENELNPMTEYVVTRWYRPPELLLAPNLLYDEAVDLWSVGCIFAEMVKRRAIFPGKDHFNQVQLIFQTMGFAHREELGFPVDEETLRILNRYRGAKQDLKILVPTATDEMVGFMEELLQVDPAKRPSAGAACQHGYLYDAETMFDYKADYLRRPPANFFEFEHRAFTLPQLQAMVLSEVAESAYVPDKDTAPISPTLPITPATPPVSLSKKVFTPGSDTKASASTGSGGGGAVPSEQPTVSRTHAARPKREVKEGNPFASRGGSSEWEAANASAYFSASAPGSARGPDSSSALTRTASNFADPPTAPPTPPVATAGTATTAPAPLELEQSNGSQGTQGSYSQDKVITGDMCCSLQ
ncbi:kinase-like domain-containing protein [Ochromonadaceae sp. CCMP2298]|nr:kinase-like domain-containing protein [Ochromonadaceae sp. CCMP2298]